MVNRSMWGHKAFLSPAIVGTSLLAFNNYCASFPFIDHSKILQKCAPDEGIVRLPTGMQMHASKPAKDCPVKLGDIKFAQDGC